MEDHHWTKTILPDGRRWIRFEPTAVVYHYGHEQRNDRVFVPPGKTDEFELVRESIRTLGACGRSWPERMSAGLTLGSLDQLPGIRDAVPAVGRTLVEDPDFDVRWRMAGALGRIGGEDAVPFLVRGLVDPSFYVRDECAWSLARLGSTATAELLAAVPNLDDHARPFAGLALGLGGGPDAQQIGVGLLLAGLSSDDFDIERDSIYFLGELSPAVVPDNAITDIAHRFDSDRPTEIVRAAVWCWGRLAGTSRHVGMADVQDLAHRHPSELVREEGVIALHRASGGQLTDDITSGLLSDGAGRVRFAAAQCARAVAASDPEAVNLLQDLPADPDFGVEFERACAVDTDVRY